MRLIVPKAIKIGLCALNYAPILYFMLKVIFPQNFRLLLSYVYHIAKNYLPLIQQIADPTWNTV